VIFVTTRTDLPGRDTILAAMAGLDGYSEVASVPVSTERDYGNFAGSIFLRNPGADRCRQALPPRQRPL
jgi:hypothetical protein